MQVFPIKAPGVAPVFTQGQPLGGGGQHPIRSLRNRADLMHIGMEVDGRLPGLPLVIRTQNAAHMDIDVEGTGRTDSERSHIRRITPGGIPLLPSFNGLKAIDPLQVAVLHSNQAGPRGTYPYGILEREQTVQLGITDGSDLVPIPVRVAVPDNTVVGDSPPAVEAGRYSGNVMPRQFHLGFGFEQEKSLGCPHNQWRSLSQMVSRNGGNLRQAGIGVHRRFLAKIIHNSNPTAGAACLLAEILRLPC